MNAVKNLKRTPLVAALAAAMLACAAGAVPAFAEVPCASCKPWWHLNVDAAPTSLDASTGKDGVEQLTINATKGDVLIANEENLYGTLTAVAYNISAEKLQEVLQTRLFPSGQVLVSGGAGNYRITFPGQDVKAFFLLPDSKELSTLVEEITGLPGGEALEGEVANEVLDQGASDQDRIVLTALNLGDVQAAGEAQSISIAGRVPGDLKTVAIEGRTFGKQGLNTNLPLKCVLESLTCTYEGGVAAGAFMEVTVSVVPENTGSVAGGEVEASISGGGAPTVSARHALFGAGVTPFGVEDYEITPEEADGASDRQAGSHPFQMTTTLTLNRGAEAGSPPALPKDLQFRLPPGLTGNPTPFAQCSNHDFLTQSEFGNTNLCPANTAIGVAMVTLYEPHAIGLETVPVPLFNLKPNVGEPARFGFMTVGVPTILDTSLRAGEDYGVTVSVENIPETISYVGSSVTFWGVPGDPRHDGSRGWECVGGEFYHHTFPEGIPACAPTKEEHPQPFLIMPTSCSAPLQTSVQVDSWMDPTPLPAVPATEPMSAMYGCNRLPFTPSIKVTPDGEAASTPTGLTVDEHVPQETDLNPTGLAESAVKGLSVTLPEGMALNPAAADGLQACSLEQIGLQNAEASTCPEASKVATVKIKTPLLPNALEGAAYLAQQNANPFGSLVAMYLYAEDPVSGVRVKATGEVVENPVTGQLTAHFEADPVFEKDPRYAGEPGVDFLPQVPFEDVELHFFGGDRAPLATPALCGSYTATGTFTPWSGNPASEASSEFKIKTGPNGGPCPNPPGDESLSTLPFAPTLTAQTTSIQAGGFSPFTTTFSRPDGQQDLRGLQLHMPPGLLGIVSSVTPCAEAQADVGTCGAASLIGHTIVSVGVGGDPYTVTGGEVFLTGPYRGAPYGLSIVNPAKAGPFDLGKVVVRAKIEVDPSTADLTVTTDSSGPYAIPHILDGIPLQIQHVNVAIDRPGFIFNPTDCDPLPISGSLESDQGVVSNLSLPFQVTNCGALGFKPQLTAATSAKATRKDGTSLAIKLTYAKGAIGKEAWFKSAKFDFPKQLPARLETLQKACPVATFEANPAGCPPGSRVGTAVVHTPVLPEALQGVVYFISYAGAKFPEAVIVLQGDNVTVDLHAETFISKAGVTSATLRSIPGVPFETVEVLLPSGPFSEFAANGNLCTEHPTMGAALTAQNGLSIHETQAINVSGCKSSITVLRHSVRRAKATIAVSVPSAGTLLASGKGLTRGSGRATGAGVVTVHLALSKRQQHLLARYPGRLLRVTVKLSFTTAHGRLSTSVALLMG
ncbi:MAG TPA: hypothetical protein VK730_11240 [Solirubrobacteraceae bacterium]|nr:hypothetical protein [Solirubrobacteraceae bacterium]